MRMQPTRVAIKTRNGFRICVKAPPFMGTPERYVDLTEEQYARFRTWIDDGGYIQELLSDLSADDRELLMSGLVEDELDV